MLAFRLGEILSHCVPRLKVYPIVILQLTTLSLLISFSSSAAALMPALVAPAVQVSEQGAVMVHEENAESPVAPEPQRIKSEDYMPLTDSKNIERFVNDYFADIPLMAKIAKCESRYRHFNKHGEVLRGEQNTYDRGVMQINLLYHEETAAELGLDVHNIDDNVAYARYLYEKQGSKPWNSSSKCWSRYVGTEIAKR